MAQHLNRDPSRTSIGKFGNQEFKMLKKNDFDVIVAQRKAKLAAN